MPPGISEESRWTAAAIAGTAYSAGGWIVKTQPAHRRAQVRRRVVPELDDERMPVERLLHDRPLHAAAAAMDEADLSKSRCVRRVDVLLDDRRNIARCKRVQIELRLDRHALDIIWLVDHAPARYFASTVVVMPPRAVNAPATVIQRGRQAPTRSSRI